MDRIAFFKNIILEVLGEQVEYFAGANMPEIQFVPITDEIHHHYQYAYYLPKNQNITSLLLLHQTHFPRFFHHQPICGLKLIRDHTIQNGFPYIVFDVAHFA